MASGKGHGVLGPVGYGVLICLIIIVPLGLGFLFQALAGGEWHWDDWASIILSILLGALFFRLAAMVDRENQQRLKTTANAVLHTTIGALKTMGVRNALRAQEHALRVSTDALAALEYFDLAEEDVRRRLIDEIEAAYSNLAFGALSRGTWLPKSTWNQIQRGADEVKAKLEKLEAFRDDSSLGALGSHITCVVKTATKLRSKGFSAITPDAPVLVAHLKVEELRCLYRNELTVIHDWDILDNETVTCSVELVEATATKDWYTPWYVTRSKGEWKPTNVKNEPLREEAAQDRIEYEGALPEWPIPLKVGEVPPGMRERAIQRMTDLIEQEGSGVVPALVYELADANARTILDGNHRVVAAVRLAAAIRPGNRPHGSFAAGAAGPDRVHQAKGSFVLAYVIKEKEPIVTKFSRSDWGDCEGFTPDVWQLREAFGRGNLRPQERISQSRGKSAKSSKWRKWRRSGTI